RRLGGALRRLQPPQACRLGLLPRRRPVPESHPDVEAGVLQVEGMGVALRAVAEHGDRAVLEHRGIGVLLVVHRCHLTPLSLTSSCRAYPAARSGRSLIPLEPRPRAIRPVLTSSMMP